jgi:apolipoprotein N-acyltransferase
MASKSDRLKGLPWLAATALAATAWWLGSGVQPLWWMAWLAPIPILWLAPRVRAGSATAAGLVAYAVGSFNLWDYLHNRVGIPLPVIAYYTVIPGVMLALCVLVYRRLLLRGRPFAAALAMPATWVAMAYLNASVSPHGTFFDIGYSQMDVPVIIQIAAITGIWGIGFLLMLLPAAVAVGVTPQVPRRARLVVAGVAAACLLASLGYGAWRLKAPATSTLRVGLVWLETSSQPTPESAEGGVLVARYVAAINRLADAGAQAVVIPEAVFAGSGPTIAPFAELAQRRHITIDATIDFHGDPKAERNMSMAFQPGAPLPFTYNKRHLIPGFEDKFTPGSEYRMLQGEPRIGLAICKDMDFHDTGRAYAAREAQLLLVPAGDFVVDGWLHSRMAVMRGVETGFAMARIARFGRLTLSDDRGRVVAEASSEEHGAELVGDVPLHETHTIYARWGDWFAWLDLIGLLVLIVLASLPAFRGPRGHVDNELTSP